MTHKAIQIHQPGGADQLRWETVPTPSPGEGEVLIRHTAIGVNYIDVYHRTGLYALPSYPAILGIEGAGVVERVGTGGSGFKIGDRVAYGGGPVGSYAQLRVIHENHLARLPEGISEQHAAAMMVKGLTAHFLVRRTFIIQPGHTILVHAAAGGVGLLLCQWAKHLGATVIGTVGSEEKAKFARENGCDHPILYKQEDVVARVKDITKGLGVNVVYDSVGKDTFMTSLDCLMPLGLMVSYGQASGSIPPIDVSLLMQKGSLFLTRPSFMHYKSDQTEYLLGIAEMFDLMLTGKLKVHVGQSYYLSDAASAHRDLEARKTHGSTILVVK